VWVNPHPGTVLRQDSHFPVQMCAAAPQAQALQAELHLLPCARPGCSASAYFFLLSLLCLFHIFLNEADFSKCMTKICLLFCACVVMGMDPVPGARWASALPLSYTPSP
jgi:hypothetical protein